MASRTPTTGGLFHVSLQQLEWATILLPPIAFFIFDFVRHVYFPSTVTQWPGQIATVLLILCASSIFSFFVFRAIHKREAAMLLRNRELAALNGIAAATSRTLATDEILGITLDASLTSLGFDAGAVYLRSEEDGGFELRAHRGISAPFAASHARMLDSAPLMQTLRSIPRPLLCQDLKVTAEGAEEWIEAGLSGFVAVAIGTQERLDGALILGSREPRIYGSYHPDFFASLGHHLTASLQNANLFRLTQQREREAEALYEIGNEVSKLLDLDSILGLVVENARQLVDSEIAMLSLLDPKRSEVRIRATAGTRSARFHEARVAVGAGMGGRVIATGAPFQTPDYLEDTTIVHDPEIDTIVAAEGLMAHLAVPLRVGENVLGALTVADRTERRYTSRDIVLLQRLANQAAIATENARLFDEAAGRAEALSALIQEMHHRIKNNLQTVADLLSLEMLKGARGAVEDRLRESINRVKSIATVHELLSVDNVDNIQATDIKKLAQLVVNTSVRTMVRPGQDVKVEVSGPSISLPSKQATALALVLNELLNNAIEHGFRGLTGGRIVVRLAEEDSTVVLCVQDDGNGLPAGFDLIHSSHLGLQIVNTLVTKDLNGSLVLRTDCGSEAIVRIRV
ncbi:MAG: GAF domain-containing protein [Chloroflexi bacterium]|nr:GAF domain-containing protein [Chloroflexota bacterium]